MKRHPSHFKRSEFACHCGCGLAAMDYELIWALKKVRDHFREAWCPDCVVVILSGCRCKEYNRKVGGVKNSYHTKCMAADFQVKSKNYQVPPDIVADFLEGLMGDSGGIGRYKTFTHLDARRIKARWKQH